MNCSIIKQLRAFYSSLVICNGILGDKPRGVLSAVGTNEDGIKVIKKVLEIILYSDKVSDFTKEYIVNSNSDVKAVCNIVNERLIKSGKIKRIMSYNFVSIAISTDNKEIGEIISEEMLRNIVYNEVSKEDIKSDLDLSMQMLVSKYGEHKKLRDNMSINVNDTVVKDIGNEDSSEFFEVLESVESYLTARMKIIEEAINQDEEFVGYFNYLLSSRDYSNGRVCSDRTKLINFLMNRGFNEDYTVSEDVLGDIEDTSFNDIEEEEESIEELGSDTCMSIIDELENGILF